MPMPVPAAVTMLLTWCLSAAVASSGGPGRAPAAYQSGPTVVIRAGAALPVAAGRYRPPVEPVNVVRPFDPPVTAYGPGHLGVDLRAAAGTVVLAAAAGVVRFAGGVAGRGLVVLVHPDGIVTEYEPVTPLVRRGQPISRGQPIGELTGRHRGCPVGCLHWGAERAGVRVDPLLLLGALAPVRLLPWPR